MKKTKISKYVLEHLNSRISYTENKIHEFQNDFVKNPYETLKRSRPDFKFFFENKKCKLILNALKNGCDLDDILRVMKKDISNRARFPEHSTCTIHNYGSMIELSVLAELEEELTLLKNER